MKNNIQIAIIHVFITTLLIVGCKSNSRHPDFEVIDFNPTKNYSDSIIHIDFENTIQNGICIPSIRQTKNGEFEFEFSIKNSGKKQKFYYKLYYQNESYKYPDEHPLADGNFYGSWEDTDKTFAETPEIDDDGEPHLITDKFRIVGNPLNDTAYFGIATQEIDSVQVKQIMDQIKSTPEWFNSIKQKAKQNQIPLERQLTLDATYVVSEKNPPRRQNNRWKRNPRIGDYSFMLVVCTSDALNKIPAYIKNIGLKNGQKYVSPYYYFLFGKGSLHKNISTAIVQKKLKAIANYDFTKGIYINPENFEKINYSKTAYSSNCNESSVLQKNAQVEQFIHEIDPNSNFDNIATTADITGNAYNLSDYNANLKKPNNIKVPIKTTTCPCSTVKIDSLSKGILIKNPASETTKFTKENVGIITRHGFTYGKFRVKVKLTELLNKYQLWNGLTNAIWLYRQKGEWNQRNLCYEQGGYIPKNQQGMYAKRTPRNSYSEIDIEIVKAPRNWPKTSYNGAQKRPDVPLNDSDKIAVTYTNWDLACQDAPNYNIGVQNIKHDSTAFEVHRWDSWYKAITGKAMASDDELFKKDYYWFEIEWKPEEIIWRMGPEKNALKEFGYMNSSITKIPDNQMLFVITQEWHLSNWWPESPFDQNFIPFPSKDIEGKILAIEIE